GPARQHPGDDVPLSRPRARGTGPTLPDRNGLVRAEFDWPDAPEDAARVADAIRTELGRVEPSLLPVCPHQAAEILLVARWFRLNPEERSRLIDPAELLDARLTA